MWLLLLAVLAAASGLRQSVSQRRLRLFEESGSDPLEPKRRFAREVLGLDPEELFRSVPEFAKANLAKVIAPNHAYLRRCGEAHGAQMSFEDVRLGLCRRRPEAEDIVAAFRRGGLYAAKNGDSLTLRDLMDHGYSPGSDRDRRGASPLHWAAGHGESKCCEALLSGKLSVDDRDAAGATPLHWAVAGVQNNAFGVGARYETANFLLNEGAKVDATTHDGNSVFHWASWAGGVDAMDMLLNRGANMTEVNVRGCGAAHWAASGGDVASLELLHSLGLSLTEPNDAGHTPLSHAVAHHRTKAVDFFVKSKIVDADALNYAQHIAHLVREAHLASSSSSRERRAVETHHIAASLASLSVPRI